MKGNVLISCGIPDYWELSVLSAKANPNVALEWDIEENSLKPKQNN